MRKQLRVIHSADRGWHIDLPTYQMIAGTFACDHPDICTPDGINLDIAPDDPRTATLTVIADIPDEYISGRTNDIHPPTIARLHAGHPIWGDAKRLYKF